MAIRMNYTTAAQFAEIVAANPDRQIYAVRKNVTGGNPNAQSFAVALTVVKLQTVGNRCIDNAMAALLDKWRFEYVKARFQDLPNNSKIDDAEFENGELARAYLESLVPRTAEKLSEVRITNWFDGCIVLHDALHSALSKHSLSERQAENQFKQFLHGLTKLVKKGAVSKKLAVKQYIVLTRLAGITAEDGVIERLILKRLNEILNEKEVEDDDDMLDLTV